MENEIIDLTNRSKFEKRIASALRSCIQAHGPITPIWIGSASKRIIATIKDHNRLIRRVNKPDETQGTPRSAE